jgi:hypothetical protein
MSLRRRVPADDETVLAALAEAGTTELDVYALKTGEDDEDEGKGGIEDEGKDLENVLLSQYGRGNKAGAGAAAAGGGAEKGKLAPPRAAKMARDSESFKKNLHAPPQSLKKAQSAAMLMGSRRWQNTSSSTPSMFGDDLDALDEEDEEDDDVIRMLGQDADYDTASYTQGASGGRGSGLMSALERELLELRGGEGVGEVGGKGQPADDPSHHHHSRHSVRFSDKNEVSTFEVLRPESATPITKKNRMKKGRTAAEGSAADDDNDDEREGGTMEGTEATEESSSKPTEELRQAQEQASDASEGTTGHIAAAARRLWASRAVELTTETGEVAAVSSALESGDVASALAASAASAAAAAATLAEAKAKAQAAAQAEAEAEAARAEAEAARQAAILAAKNKPALWGARAASLIDKRRKSAALEDDLSLASSALAGAATVPAPPPLPLPVPVAETASAAAVVFAASAPVETAIVGTDGDTAAASAAEIAVAVDEKESAEASVVEPPAALLKSQTKGSLWSTRATNLLDRRRSSLQKLDHQSKVFKTDEGAPAEEEAGEQGGLPTAAAAAAAASVLDSLSSPQLTADKVSLLPNPSSGSATPTSSIASRSPARRRSLEPLAPMAAALGAGNSSSTQPGDADGDEHEQQQTAPAIVEATMSKQKSTVKAWASRSIQLMDNDAKKRGASGARSSLASLSSLPPLPREPSPARAMTTNEGPTASALSAAADESSADAAAAALNDEQETTSAKPKLPSGEDKQKLKGNLWAARAAKVAEKRSKHSAAGATSDSDAASPVESERTPSTSGNPPPPSSQPPTVKGSLWAARAAQQVDKRKAEAEAGLATGAGTGAAIAVDVTSPPLSLTTIRFADNDNTGGAKPDRAGTAAAAAATNGVAPLSTPAGALDRSASKPGLWASRAAHVLDKRRGSLGKATSSAHLTPLAPLAYAGPLASPKAATAAAALNSTGDDDFEEVEDLSAYDRMRSKSPLVKLATPLRTAAKQVKIDTEASGSSGPSAGFGFTAAAGAGAGSSSGLDAKGPVEQHPRLAAMDRSMSRQGQGLWTSRAAQAMDKRRGSLGRQSSSANISGSGPGPAGLAGLAGADRARTAGGTGPGTGASAGAGAGAGAGLAPLKRAAPSSKFKRDPSKFGFDDADDEGSFEYAEDVDIGAHGAAYGATAAGHDYDENDNEEDDEAGDVAPISQLSHMMKQKSTVRGGRFPQQKRPSGK